MSPALPSLTGKRAILFDFDGTLADCFEDIRAAVNYAMRGVGLPEHSLETVRSMIGDGMRVLTRRACGPDGGAHVEQAIALLAEHYRAHPADHGRLYDGVPELLRALRDEGRLLAIVSNKPHPMMVDTAAHFDVTEYFDVILGETERFACKPKPDMLLGVLEMLDVAPADAVMIGDGTMDIEAARAAGVTAVGVAWGMTDWATLAKAGVDVMAHDVKGLTEALLGDRQPAEIGDES